MIQQLKKLPPFIDFGLGITQKTITLGETVKVWVSSIYNIDEYKVNYGTVSLTKITEFEYEFTPGSTGTYNIDLAFDADLIGTTPQSNTITLTVE